MKKRIVILRSNPVNPDSRVEKEANSLLKAGYSVQIVAWDREKKYSYAKSNIEVSDSLAEITRFGIPATYGDGMKNLKAFIKFQVKLLTWLLRNKHKYDLVHACDFDTAFIAFICKIFTNKKLVFDIFDYLYTDIDGNYSCLKRFIVYLQHKIINNAEGTIICSEDRTYQIKGSHPRKLTVIHNSPEIPKTELTKIRLDERKIKIAYVGILQDSRFLIELSEVVKQDDRLELHIGGFGKYEDYFIECSQNYKNIIFYGKLTYANTLILENSCDLMTAIYDPKIGNHIYAAPNKFYEGLMLGKPLIMVKGTGMSSVVEDNNIGVVIDYTMNSLSEGINKLIENKSNWIDMEYVMKKIYAEKYSWSEMESRLLRFYNSIFMLNSDSKTQIVRIDKI
jgi:glycosyltransferase involved in cell wall biosynthesis